MEIRKLCKRMPESAAPNASVASVAHKLFDVDHYGRYCHSSVLDVGRYQLYFDQKLIEQISTDAKTDLKYGPFEQYLLKKLCSQEGKSLLFLVGGFGVGKTRTTRFLVESLPRLPNVAKAIYVDTHVRTDKAWYDNLSGEVTSSVSRMICEAIYEQITPMVGSLSNEISKVWDALVADEQLVPGSSAATWLKNELRRKEADGPAMQAALRSTLSKRRAIKESIWADEDLKRSYVAALCHYCATKQADKGNNFVVIVIDNLDQQPAKVQLVMRTILLPFGLSGRVKVLVPVRPTTFFQRFYRSVAVMTEDIPHCGPEPSEVVDARLRDFIKNPGACVTGLDLEEGEVEKIQHTCQRLRLALKNPSLKHFIGGISGWNVRKGLEMGQRLLSNSVYDPLVSSNAQITDQSRLKSVFRALLVGERNSYQWSEKNIVDNLFQVNERRGVSYWVKIRILLFLEASNGQRASLNRITSSLSNFGYDMSLIDEALSELVRERVTLVWSDSGFGLKNEEQILARGNSLFTLSSAGKGYLDYILADINYIQEMMLDTEVNGSEFGDDVDYGSLAGRFDALFRFLNLLVREDLFEMKLFLKKASGQIYRSDFGTSELASFNVVRKVARVTRSIFQSTIDKHKKSESGYASELESFLEKQKLDYAGLYNLTAAFRTDLQVGVIGAEPIAKGKTADLEWDIWTTEGRNNG